VLKGLRILLGVGIILNFICSDPEPSFKELEPLPKKEHIPEIETGEYPMPKQQLIHEEDSLTRMYDYNHGDNQPGLDNEDNDLKGYYND
jgi:hypothetical protein